MASSPGDRRGGYGSYPGFIAGIGAIVMGSTTYEWIVEYLKSSG